MPKAKVNGVELYYEVHGAESAEPLFMIQGLGYDARFWFKQVPELSHHFRLILFDNRDVGRSGTCPSSYTIADMAADAIGLLDHLGIKQSHVLGVSMGGYIAQELAIAYPHRVKKLVLIATHYGGPEYFELVGDLWKEILDVAGLSLDEVYRRGFQYAVCPEFFEREKEIIDQMVKMRLDLPQAPSAFQRQFTAAKNFYSKERVHLIAAPTLLLAGEEDRVVPLILMQRLAERIPNARLVVVKKAAHLLFIEKPAIVNQEIIQFLKSSPSSGGV